MEERPFSVPPGNHLFAKEVLSQEGSITIRLLEKAPSFIEEQYPGHIVFDILLPDLLASKEMNFDIQDKFVEPSQILPAAGIIRVRNVTPQPLPGNQFFVLFPQNAFSFRQQKDLVLKIYDKDNLQVLEEHYILLEGLTEQNAIPN